MCGIVGALVFDSSPFRVSESYIARMRDTMAHRGPDGAGLWVSDDRHAGLGHRRLSIIDLSEAASQPMSNEDGTLWIVFNGEIYNHADIRTELEALGGHRWKTDHSDTEVILHAFEQWGIDCLHRFRGMFAFAIWDGIRRELWLVRDRIGIKPLYYSVHHGRLIFASEIKALLEDPQQRRAVNEEGLYHYLSFLTAPAPMTLFDGIEKLPGGTWLRVNKDGVLHKQRYWDVLDHARPLTEQGDEEIAQRLLEELRVSVRLRKVSDVPVGVFLSGGIDSSTNTALFSDGEKKPVKTFSIGYRGDHKSYVNELHFARAMADFAGAEYHEKLLDIADLLDFLPLMVRLQDEPIADPVCVPVYYVSKLARENNVIVCQVGEGADELFFGYPHWKTSLRLQRLNNLPVPLFVKRTALDALSGSGKQRSFRYEWLRRGISDEPIFWGGAEAFTEGHKKMLLSQRLRQKFKTYSSWEPVSEIFARFHERAWEKSILNWMTYVDLNMRLPELLLMRIDKMTMGVSLEGRVPFLDHRLVEFAMSIPESVKTKNGELKPILKKAVRGLIPDELIDREKQGFGVPISEWFMGRLGGRIRDDMNDFCRETDFLDREEVFRLIESGSPQSWYLHNLALWWTSFVRA